MINASTLDVSVTRFLFQGVAVAVVIVALAMLAVDGWSSPTVVATRPGIRLPRSAWTRAEPDSANLTPMGAIEKITIHHSGSSITVTGQSATARRIENIRRDHRNGKGWADIAYHLVVDRAGRQWEARDLGQQGAHAGDFELNRGNIGVMLLGDFEQQEPSIQQLESLDLLLQELLKTYGLDREDVVGHRDLRATLCPGADLASWLNAWRG